MSRWKGLGCRNSSICQVTSKSRRCTRVPSAHNRTTRQAAGCHNRSATIKSCQPLASFAALQSTVCQPVYVNNRLPAGIMYRRYARVVAMLTCHLRPSLTAAMEHCTACMCRDAASGWCLCICVRPEACQPDFIALLGIVGGNSRRSRHSTPKGRQGGVGRQDVTWQACSSE